jgi:hypothetical protein
MAMQWVVVVGSSHLVYHVFTFILIELHRLLLLVPSEACGHTCTGSGTLEELYVYMPQTSAHSRAPKREATTTATSGSMQWEKRLRAPHNRIA